jgi:choloylglycine hydrolase
MCTDFLVTGADGSFVNGRSMEFGANLNSQVLFRAVGTTFTLSFPTVADSLTITAKYGYAALTSTLPYVGYKTPFAQDGMNTAGLSTGSLWFAGAQYPVRSTASGVENVFVGFFVEWVLASFATVAEVQAAIASGQFNLYADALISQYFPLHFPVHDATGASIAIEFIGGQVQVTENPAAVLTNEPALAWQLTHLSAYSAVSANDPPPVTINGVTYPAIGHGAGLSALPGDPLPLSRFVRAAFMRQFSLPPQTAADACNLAFHILNTVDIPQGVVGYIDSLTKQQGYDYTQWVVVKDLTNLALYIRAYASPSVYVVPLTPAILAQENGKSVAVPSTPLANLLPLS